MNLHTQAQRRRQCRGQTIIEVYIILGVLVLLGAAVAAVLIPRLDAARRARVEKDLEHLESALRSHFAKHGHYPDETEGLQALAASGDARSVGPDPWRNDYVYLVEDGVPVILSYGEDGVPGGDGIDADLARPVTPGDARP